MCQPGAKREGNLPAGSSTSAELQSSDWPCICGVFRFPVGVPRPTTRKLCWRFTAPAAMQGRERLACAEAALDEEEGADILMVKPAMPLHLAASFHKNPSEHLPSTSWLRPYLDIIKGLHEQSNLPIAAYHAQPLSQGLTKTSHGSHGSRSPENMPCSRLQL